MTDAGMNQVQDDKFDVARQALNHASTQPHEVYRLAIIVQGLMDSLGDPAALETIRYELHTLIKDTSPLQPGT
jgi:hypothetical protein